MADHPSPAGQLGVVLGVLRRRARLIAAVVLAGTALALAAGWRAPTLYTAKALVAIERPLPTVPSTSSVPVEPLDPAAVREEMQVLNSYEQARLVVEDMDLASDPEFQPQPPSATARLRAAVAARLASLLPAPHPAEGRDPAPETGASPAEDAAIRLFRSRMVAVQEEESRVIAVSFTSASATKAARIANRTVELFLRHEAEAKRAEARKAAEWLSDRLEGLRTDVERDEASVQAYRTRFNLAPSGGTDVVDQQVADINRELVAARGDLAQRQASVAFARELGAHGRGREGLPEVMNSTVITDLRRQEGELLRSEAELRLTYGEKHPRLQLVHAQREDLAAKIGQEADRIVASLESQATTAQARVAALQQQLDGVLGTRTRNREAELQLGELERKAAASQRLYELFLQQSKEAEEAAAIVVPGGRILSRAAVPDSPSTPGLTMFAIFGLISSAMAGGVLGLLRDRLDDRVRDAQQVRAAVGLPCIATIPKLDRRADRPGKADGGLDAYVEAMRSVLAAMHLRGDGPPRMVLVTSPLPGEGRTTLSASLAAYAARLGRRVLLIDLDTRRGQGGLAEESGLVDRLLGDLPFEDLIRRDDALRVDFIASGRQRGDLMTLLLNGQLRQLLWRLGGCYDLVVVDCPPVLAAADARMLAPIVDRVLLVVRWNTTRIPLLRGAVEALREVGANVAGVVLVQAPSPSILRARRPVTLRLAASGPEASAADPAPAAPGGIAAQVRGFALSARRRRGAAAAPQRAARPRPFGGARERGG